MGEREKSEMNTLQRIRIIVAKMPHLELYCMAAALMVFGLASISMGQCAARSALAPTRIITCDDPALGADGWYCGDGYLGSEVAR